MVGRVVSHYRVIEQIGAGGMGVVYKAEDTRLGRALALKFLPADASSDQLALERFQREARTASTFNHPAICTIYDIGEFEGRQFIAMELLDGQPLDQHIAGKPLPINRVLDLGIQIADALDTAHSLGILHRDIKPANIFVTQRAQAKVLDFGLAKLTAGGRGSSAMAQTVAESMLTTAGLAVGTVAYMSPEQARGEDLDQRSDLFSFGVVLHEMATGRQAFQGNTTAVVFDAILNRMPPPVSVINPAVPPELERIIDKALEKDRDLRYQTAADMKSDLQRLRRDRDSGRGVMVGSGGVPAASGGYRTARLSSGVPAAAATTVESEATPAAPVTTPPPPSIPAAAPPAAAVAPKPQPAVPKAKPAAGNKNTMIAVGGGVLLLLIAIAGFAFWKSSGSQPEPVTTQVAEAPPEAAPPVTPPTDVAAPAPEAGTPPTTDPGEVPGATSTTPPPPTPPPDAAAAPPAVAAPPPGTAVKPGTPSTTGKAAAKKGTAIKTAAAAAPPPPAPAAPVAPAPPPAPELDPVREAVSLANGQIEAKQYEQALANLQGALGRKPGSSSAPQANLLVARIYDRQRRTEAAMAAYEAVKTRYPRDPVTAEALFRLAELVQDTKQSDRLQTARGYLDSVVNDFGSSSFAPRALQWRAAIEDRQNLKTNDSVVGKQVPTSLVTLRQLAERYPNSQPAEEALWKMANHYEDLKRFDLAAVALTDLGARFPRTRYDAWWEAGELYEKRLKDDANAKQAYSKVPSSSRRYRDAQRKIQ
jgi:TolA-binding protein/predicted Ser/Thr protein kinase